jgi:transposase-like protein
MDSLLTIRGQACPNPACPGKTGATRARVRIHSRTTRRLRCALCGTTWVTRRASIAFRLHHDDATVLAALNALATGASVRAVARELRVSPSTVLRWRNRGESTPLP